LPRYCSILNCWNWRRNLQSEVTPTISKSNQHPLA
jgi:hypothetical protein